MEHAYQWAVTKLGGNKSFPCYSRYSPLVNCEIFAKEFNFLLTWSQIFVIWVLKPLIIFIIFWDFLMFYQIFFSPQVKRSAIITYKHGIYELPHVLPNNLRLRKLGNIREVSKPHRMIAQWPVPTPKWKSSNTRRQLLKDRN